MGSAVKIRRHFMKRSMALAGIFTVFLALSPVFLNGPGKSLSARAQSPDRQDEQAMRFHLRGRTCSLSTLKGAYGVLMQGEVINWPGFPKGPIAVIAIIDFDGNGNYKSYANSANLNGYNFNQPDFSGTYVVNSDCTGTVMSPLGIFSIVIADDGREYRVLWGPGAGQVISGRVVRISAAQSDLDPFERARSFFCSPGAVAGSYAITWYGSVINPAPQAHFPLSGVTLFTHANDSTITGTGKFDFNGNKEPVNILINSTVNSNCTFSGVSTTGDRYVGVFVGEGNEYFVLSLPPESVPNLPGQGKVMFGIAKRVNSR